MPGSAKSGQKSGKRPGTFTGADDPRRGRGPAKGAPNAGRPPDELKRKIQELLDSPECMGTLETILKRGGMTRPELWAKVWSQAWDKVIPKPPVAIEGGDERKPLTIRLVREVK